MENKFILYWLLFKCTQFKCIKHLLEKQEDERMYWHVYKYEPVCMIKKENSYLRQKRHKCWNVLTFLFLPIHFFISTSKTSNIFIVGKKFFYIDFCFRDCIKFETFNFNLIHEEKSINNIFSEKKLAV